MYGEKYPSGAPGKMARREACYLSSIGYPRDGDDLNGESARRASPLVAAKNLMRRECPWLLLIGRN